MGLLSNYFRRFRKNPFMIDEKLMIQEAFKWGGKMYYQCSTATDMASGRGMTAMIFYEEWRMKCDDDYLNLHIRAIDKILGGESGKINLNDIRFIHQTLKERVNLVAMPEYLYKLASVYFWDDNESPYYYDFEYNKKKIDGWKKDPETLSFFLTKPLKELVPFFVSQEMSAETYLMIADQIDKQTRQNLQAALSEIK